MGKIKQYKVVRSTGKRKEQKSVESYFPNEGEIQNPLSERRKAVEFAKNLYEVIRQANEDGLENFVTEYAINDLEANTFSVTVNAIIQEENGEEYEIEIYGELLQLMIDNWEIELDCYLENGYDTDGPVYNLDASGLNANYIT